MRSGVTARNLMNQQAQLERERPEGAVVILDETDYGKKSCFGYNTEGYCTVDCDYYNDCLNASIKGLELEGRVVIIDEWTPYG